jgi:hypothetical protein
MTIINVNSISGINSITAQGASGIEFYDSSGNSVQTVTGDGLTVGTGATISGSTNTITASTNGEERLSIDSSGLTTLSGTGDVTLYLKADTDNVDEDHNPKISMSQDGGTSSYFDIGITGSAGGEFTDALANTAYIKSVSNATTNGIQFATNGAARMYLNNSGNLGIGTALTGASSNTKLTLQTTGSSACRLVLANSGSSTAESTQIWSQNDELAFNAGGSEQARITADGLKLASGNGINFANYATSGNPSSNLLDDYEEGTFTPTSTGLNLSSATGHYVKVGSLVTCVFYIDIGTKTYINGGSGSTTFEIQLPFISNNISNPASYAGASIGNVRYVDFTGSSALQFAMNIGGNSDKLTGRWIKNNSNFDVITLGDLYNAFSVHASVTYRVA